MTQGKRGTGLSGTYEGKACKHGHTARYKNGGGCIQCMKDAAAHRWRNDPNFRDRKKMQAHTPQGKAASRENQYRRLYGITIVDYEKMQSDQGHACALCGTNSPGGSSGRFHIDHDHITGLIRALLCYKCNIGLGSFDDNPDKLRLAIAYLGRF